MKETKSVNYMLVESFMIYIQKNFDLIEKLVKEIRKCKNPEEQRCRIFDFMVKCLSKNKTLRAMQLICESNTQRPNVNIRHNLKAQPVKSAIENIMQTISLSPVISRENKKIYLKRLKQIDINLLEEAYITSIAKITPLDMKYIICFITEIEEKDIGMIFNVLIKSVHKTRYRIKKKFSKEDSFRVVL